MQVHGFDRTAPEMTNAPTQDAVGARMVGVRRPGGLVLLRGPPGYPGLSTDSSVTDGLRWIGHHNSVVAAISQNGDPRSEPGEYGRTDQTGVGA